MALGFGGELQLMWVLSPQNACSTINRDGRPGAADSKRATFNLGGIQAWTRFPAQT